MIGDPSQFEAIGNRLGFNIIEDSPERLRLRWQGARFPAFLCIGIAVLLLFVSVPILQALHLRGGPSFRAAVDVTVGRRAARTASDDHESNEGSDEERATHPVKYAAIIRSARARGRSQRAWPGCRRCASTP
jgi:hypothetical protein